MITGSLQLFAELVVRHGLQGFGQFNVSGPDNRHLMRVCQGQEGQRAAWHKHLPGDAAMRLLSVKYSNDALLRIIPEDQWQLGPLTRAGAGTVGSDKVVALQLAAVRQSNLYAIVIDLLRLHSGAGHKPNPRSFGGIPQRLLQHRVFDNSAEIVLMDFGGIKLNTAKTVAIPYFHAGIGAEPFTRQCRPHPQLLQQAAAAMG